MDNELRYDHVKKRWVSVAPGRAMRPSDFPISKIGATLSNSADTCPFCEGREEYTPEEIDAVRKPNSAANGPGWLARVIPNKFSAFDTDGTFEPEQKGFLKSAYGFGRHEVVVETPQHNQELCELTPEHILSVLQLERARYLALSADKRFKYIHIYKNSGMYAGASLLHSHSQIVALPFENTENYGLPEYYQREGRCAVCDLLADDPDGRRLIHQGKHFAIVCPYASRFAYDAWIVPLKHQEHFGDMDDVQAQELAVLIKTYLRAMMDCLEKPSFNTVITTAPINAPYREGYHWFMEITPKLLVPAALEMGTGVFVNFAAPEAAARMLRESFIKCM